jgi:hypothetical protein
VTEQFTGQPDNIQEHNRLTYDGHHSSLYEIKQHHCTQNKIVFERQAMSRDSPEYFASNVTISVRSQLSGVFGRIRETQLQERKLLP